MQKKYLEICEENQLNSQDLQKTEVFRDIEELENYCQNTEYAASEVVFDLKQNKNCNLHEVFKFLMQNQLKFKQFIIQKDQ